MKLMLSRLIILCITADFLFTKNAEVASQIFQAHYEVDLYNTLQASIHCLTEKQRICLLVHQHNIRYPYVF